MTDTVAGSTTASADTGTEDPTAYSHRQILTILSGLLLGMFLAALDQTVVSTAIYRIGESLHGLTAQAWVTTAFLITSTISTPLYGKLSDQYGRKPFFLFAISVFILGSALCTLSTSMYMLAAFRAFQGIGAGGLMSLALSITGDIIPPRKRASYQGYFMATFATSSVLGPVVGGALAGRDTLLGIDGWRWIFLINVPIGMVALTVVTKVLKVTHDPTPHKVDYAGALALATTLVPLLIVAEQGRTWGWASTGAVTCYAVGLIGFACFLQAERRAGDEAMIPLRLFHNRVYSIGSTLSTILGIGMFGNVTLLPLYLQLVKGNSPTRAGLLTLPLVAGIMLATLVAGQFTARTGRYKHFPIIGAAVMATGMLLLWRLKADSSYLHVDAAMFITGAGLGLGMQTIVLAMQNGVSPRDNGVATSSATFFRQLGGTVGVAVYLSIVYSTVGAKIGNAYHAAQSDPQFAAAAKANPDAVNQLRSASSSALNDTSFLQHFTTTLTQPFRVGFTDAITVCFLIGAGVMVLAFVLTWLMPEVPLRATSAEFARRAEAQAEASELRNTEMAATQAAAGAKPTS